jgi:hypothetical protein
VATLTGNALLGKVGLGIDFFCASMAMWALLAAKPYVKGGGETILVLWLVNLSVLVLCAATWQVWKDRQRAGRATLMLAGTPGQAAAWIFLAEELAFAGIIIFGGRD